MTVLSKLTEDYLAKARADGHVRLQGEGKSERIFYVADNNHSEKWTDPEEKVRAAFYAELIRRYEYDPAKIGVKVTVPRRTPLRSVANNYQEAHDELNERLEEFLETFEPEKA